MLTIAIRLKTLRAISDIGDSACTKEQQSVFGSELQNIQAAIIASLLRAHSGQFKQMQSHVRETNKRLDYFVSDLIITPEELSV